MHTPMTRLAGCVYQRLRGGKIYWFCLPVCGKKCIPKATCTDTFDRRNVDQRCDRDRDRHTYIVYRRWLPAFSIGRGQWYKTESLIDCSRCTFTSMDGMAMGELMHIPVHSSFLPSLDRLALSGTIDRIISLKSKKKSRLKKALDCWVEIGDRRQ